MPLPASARRLQTPPSQQPVCPCLLHPCCQHPNPGHSCLSGRGAAAAACCCIPLPWSRIPGTESGRASCGLPVHGAGTEGREGVRRPAACWMGTGWLTRRRGLGVGGLTGGCRPWRRRHCCTGPVCRLWRAVGTGRSHHTWRAARAGRQTDTNCEEYLSALLSVARSLPACCSMPAARCWLTDSRQPWHSYCQLPCKECA